MVSQIRSHVGRIVGKVYPDTGEDARELLHITLRVAAVDSECVQLQQLARVVFVDVVCRVLLVVEIANHRGMAQRRHDEIAEASKRVRADGAIFVVAHEHANVRLVLMDVEVIHPEPGHLLAQLIGGVERAQKRA